MARLAAAHRRLLRLGALHEGPEREGQGKATFGYEMFRASTIRLSAHFDATLPMFRLTRTTTDVNTGIEDDDHVYAPTFQLSLALGWGGRGN